MNRSASHGDTIRNEILHDIIDYISIHGYAPTVREICFMTGLKSTSTVKSHISKLIDSGLLETDDPGCPRALRVKGYAFVKTDAAGDNIR